MKSCFSTLRRIVRGLLFAGLPTALVTSSFAAATASGSGPEVTPGVVYQRVASLPGLATEIGAFGTSPESPDGRRIAFVAFEWNPPKTKGPSSKAGYSKGGLYLCNADLKNPVKLRDITRTRWHDGAMQIWLDDDTLAYMDYLPEKGCYGTYVIRSNGDLVFGPMEASVGHGDTPNESVLLIVDKKKYPNGSSLGRSGLYLYHAGTVKQVVDLERDLGALKDRLKSSDAPADWMIAHAQLSTEGNYISIRLDTGKGLENLVTCKLDGSDVRPFGTKVKPLHQQWYDDSTIFGHLRGGGADQLKAVRWDRDGKYIQTLTGPGNHMGISPDRKYLVSETIYETDPVVMRLYRTGTIEPLAVLVNVHAGPIWRNGTHMNPAFSRDGKSVYFNMPVDGMPQAHRIDLSRLIRERK